MPDNKLKKPWIPVWPEDFTDLRNMSKTAFILRQLYRVKRNPNTNICKLSEYEIQSLTGWDRKTIRTAKHKLISLGEILPQGSRIFLILPFHRYPDKTEEFFPCYKKNQQGKKYPTLGEKFPYQQGKNSSVPGEK